MAFPVCSIVGQLLSRVWLFATPWIAAHQASLSITDTWSLLKLMSIASVMPSNHLILCCPLLLQPSIFPSIRVFSNQWLFASGIQSIGAFASASVLPVNITLLSKDPSHLNANRPGQRPSPWQWQTLPAPLSFGRRLLQSPLSTRLSDQLQPDGISKNVACSHAWELNVWLAFSRRIRIHNVA